MITGRKLTKSEELLIMNREKPITPEEMKGFGKQPITKPKIQPMVTSIQDRDKRGKKVIVPLVGVKGNF